MAAVNVDVGGIANGLFGLIDKLFTTDEERSNARLRLLELIQAGELAQIGVNAEEAKSESIFVSGWRPFIGWICGVAFAYAFIIQPFLVYLMWTYTTLTGDATGFEGLPRISLTDMMPVLLGLLGLGGYRTYEKLTGSNTNR